MWVLAMFDLPVDDQAARRRYARFRKSLIKDGFNRLQYSVYARCCASRENAEVHSLRVEKAVPEDGEVRVFQVTDKQFERMKVFWGRSRKPAEKPPQQLTMF
jgi:CRISPR-associated protein Cas2